MVITALSKHLPLIFAHFDGDQGNRPWLNCMLDLAYLAESARYHTENLLRLTSGRGNSPDNFQSGVDFSGPELDRHWRVMASYIEFEAFLSSAKRFLDRAWCSLGEEIGGDFAKIRTLGKVLLRNESWIREIRQQLRLCEYFNLLETAWNEWGNELASIRNYAEHNSPFGGRSVAYSIQQQSGEQIVLLLPDRIPDNKELTSKDKLSYSTQRWAADLVKQSMADIDHALERLVAAADLHHKQCASRRSAPK